MSFSRFIHTKHFCDIWHYRQSPFPFLYEKKEEEEEEESGKVKSELVFESKENFGYRNLKVEKAKEWGRIDILHAWAEKSWVMIW